MNPSPPLFEPRDAQIRGTNLILGQREVLLGLWGGDRYFFPGVCWMLFVSDHNSYTPFRPHSQVLLGWFQIT